VNGRGQPQASPVWFYWDGTAIHIATRPDAPKVRNVRARPAVSFSVDGAAAGDLVVTIEGDATVDDELACADDYVTKYAGGMDRLAVTPGEYLAEFSAALRITPTRWRVFTSE
jgi:PPOX class probable F420-dependent enzyme